jgi:AcrR family transcriptional regulator
VLASTIEILAADGYRRLSIEDVAQRAGVHKTTVYRRWPTKAALVADALADVATDREVVPDTSDLRHDLQVLAADVARRLSDPIGGAVAAALVVESQSSDEVAELGHAFLGARLDQAEARVEAGVRRGELPAGTDARLLVEAIVGPLWFRRLVTGEAVDLRVARRLVDQVLPGT